MPDSKLAPISTIVPAEPISTAESVSAAAPAKAGSQTISIDASELAELTDVVNHPALVPIPHDKLSKRHREDKPAVRNRKLKGV